jgi:UDP-glucose 4-epimerase
MLSRKKNALVTGGAGFLGSHMVDLLLKKNFKVVVIDNFSGGDIKNLKHNLKNKKIKILKLDIRDFRKIKPHFKNIDQVYHFAGKGDIVPSIDYPSDYIKINVDGTQNVFEASRKNNVKNFIYAASSSCYGKIGKYRIKEDNKINIEHPYALSKYLGEQLVLNLGKIYNIRVNSIRIFNAYGPRVKTTGAYGAVIGIFFKQKLCKKPLTIVGDGKQSRDFIHVKDVVRAFYLINNSKLNNEVFNLGSGCPKTVNELARMISHDKIYIPDRPGEPRHTWANISKIKKKIRWKPVVNFNEGIAEMLKNINYWSNAPLWDKKKIYKATKNWFKIYQKKKL